MKQRGILLVLTAAALWGISGSVAQYLFQQKGFAPDWLVDVRLLAAGAGMLLITSLRGSGKRVLAIWRSPRDVGELLLFSLLGMLAVQYTYFTAIRHSNAATATVLQYLAPALICCYTALRRRRLPSPREWMGVGLSFAGILLLATHGRIGSLAITPAAFLWGLGSAVALGFYTIQPTRLLREWGSAMIVGWGNADRRAGPQLRQAALELQRTMGCGGCTRDLFHRAVRYFDRFLLLHGKSEASGCGGSQHSLLSGAADFGLARGNLAQDVVRTVRLARSRLHRRNGHPAVCSPGIRRDEGERNGAFFIK